MRTFLIIGIILASMPQSKTSIYSVDIYDYNYSMAFNLKYHLTNDSITVLRLNGLKGEHSICLFQKKISNKDQNHLFNIINSSSFKNLKKEYKNSLVADGDQKTIVLQINGSKKVIEIENVYISEIAKLIDNINPLLGKKLKINYIKN